MKAEHDEPSYAIPQRSTRLPFAMEIAASGYWYAVPTYLVIRAGEAGGFMPGEYTLFLGMHLVVYCLLMALTATKAWLWHWAIHILLLPLAARVAIPDGLTAFDEASYYVWPLLAAGMTTVGALLQWMIRLAFRVHSNEGVGRFEAALPTSGDHESTDGKRRALGIGMEATASLYWYAYPLCLVIRADARGGLPNVETGVLVALTIGIYLALMLATARHAWRWHWVVHAICFPAIARIALAQGFANLEPHVYWIAPCGVFATVIAAAVAQYALRKWKRPASK